MRWAAAFLTTVLAVASAGCGGLPGTPMPTIALRVAMAQPSGSPCMSSLIHGVLVADVESGVGLNEGSGPPRQIVWPYGYTAVGPDPVIVLDETGRQVARVGDKVSIGGGSFDEEGTWWACGGVRVLP